jgi:hypothetical protein
MESDELEPQDDQEEVADSTGETAEQPEERIAGLRRIAAQVDTQPSLSATERLRRRLPGMSASVTPAGPQPVEVIARHVSALQPDRKSLPQELGLAGLQVWQSLSEAGPRSR